MEPVITNFVSPGPLSENTQLLTEQPTKQKLRYLRIYLQIYMGKCKFNRIWLENIEFSAWLKPVMGNVFLSPLHLLQTKLAFV